MLAARMDEGVIDMTLGDFLSICDGNAQITLLIEEQNGKTVEFCTILAWQLEKLVEVLGFGDAKDIQTGVEFFTAEDKSKVDVCLKREDEE